MNKKAMEEIVALLKSRGATVEDLARMTMSKIRLLTSYPRFACLFSEEYSRAAAMADPEVMDEKIVKDMMVDLIAAASGLAAMMGDEFEFGGFHDDGWHYENGDTYPAIEWFIAGKIGPDAASNIISEVKEMAS